jgi:hypothetical protein
VCRDQRDLAESPRSSARSARERGLFVGRQPECWLPRGGAMPLSGS